MASLQVSAGMPKIVAPRRYRLVERRSSVPMDDLGAQRLAPSPNPF